MRDILSKATAGTKLFYLFLFSFIGLLVATFFSALVASAFNNPSNAATPIYISSLSQAVCMFLLPAYWIAKWGSGDAVSYLRITIPSSFFNEIGFGLLIFAISYIFIAFLAQWNKELGLPEALSGIERWMREMEDAALKTTDTLLSSKSPYRLLLNLLIIALLASVSEEFFFRGVLQQLLTDMVKNAHVGVWLSAFIFSVMHLQFFGFFPRWILGVLLGYLFLYTRSLWIPIIFHFLNNAVIVLVFYFGSESQWMDTIESLPISPLFVILAIGSALCTYFLFRKYAKASAEE